MNKLALKSKIAKLTGMPRSEVGKIIQLTLDEIQSALATGHSVHLTSLGTFQVHRQAQRTHSHPRTHEALRVASRRYVRFRASAQMRRMMKADDRKTEGFSL